MYLNKPKYLVLLFLLAMPGLSDPVPVYPETWSGLVFPVKNAGVKLVKEELKITISFVKPPNYIQERAMALIDCNLWFKSEKRKTITLAIPMAENTNPWIIVNGKKDGLPFCSKRTGCNFAIALRPEDYKQDIVKYYEDYGIKVFKINKSLIEALPLEWDHLVLYNITLEPNEEKVVTIYYKQELGEGIGPHEFKYLISTIKFWNSTPEVNVIAEIEGDVIRIEPKPSLRFGNTFYWHNITEDIIITVKQKTKFDFSDFLVRIIEKLLSWMKFLSQFQQSTYLR